MGYWQDTQSSKKEVIKTTSTVSFDAVRQVDKLEITFHFKKGGTEKETFIFNGQTWFRLPHMLSCSLLEDAYLSTIFKNHKE